MSKTAKSTLVDPSLSKEGDVIYEKDVLLKFKDREGKIIEDAPFHLRIIIYSTEEQLKQETKKREFYKIRMEMTLEADIFFFIYTEIDSNTYDQLAEQYNLTCGFFDFPDQFITYMGYNDVKDENYPVEFSEKTEGDFVLSFSQKLEIRNIHLFDVHFFFESDDFIKRQIQYRFDFSRESLRNAREERSELVAQMNKNKEGFIASIPQRNSVNNTPKSASVKSPKVNPTP